MTKTRNIELKIQCPESQEDNEILISIVRTIEHEYPSVVVLRGKIWNPAAFILGGKDDE